MGDAAHSSGRTRVRGMAQFKEQGMNELKKMQLESDK
jgi:hypothetical protein